MHDVNNSIYSIIRFIAVTIYTRQIQSHNPNKFEACQKSKASYLKPIVH